MSSENTVRTFEFSVAGPGPWVPASNSLLVQTNVGVSVEAVTLIGQAPEVLGTVAAGDFDRYDTAHAFVRLVASGAGSAAISASIPAPAGAGGGGGGSSDTTEATQILVKTAVQSIDAKMPAPARKQLVRVASPTVTYIGEADRGTATSAAGWLIKRITSAGDDATIEYSDDNVIFDNRASLGYT